MKLTDIRKNGRFTGGRTALMLFILLGCAASAPAQVIIRAPAERPISAVQRAAVVEEVSAALLKTYVYPDTAEKMAALIRQKLADGAYDELENGPRFCSTLTEDLRGVSHDLHLSVFATEPRETGAAEAPDPAADERRQQENLDRQRRRNYDFQKVEILEGNVGYLRLNSFTGAEISGDTAVAAMNFLANCDAVIFDLRGNGGGDPSLIQLITSYFVEQPTHLNSFYIRESDTTRQFWTAEHVQGPRMTGADLYVLTSGHTFSGAEEFSYNMKAMKRATLVGETTGGGAHPVNFVSFPDLGVSMSLPYGRAVNPITGTNWEGTGVEPDIVVPAEKALDTAHMEALKRLGEQAESAERAAELEQARRVIKARVDPVVLDEAAMNEYAGSYGDRRIIVEDGGMVYRRGQMPQRRMVALGGDQFILEGADGFVLQIERDGQGRITAAVGLYDNGQRDVSPRDE